MILLIYLLRETVSFYEPFIECLNNPSSRVFNSAVKVLADFNLLVSGKILKEKMVLIF